MIVVATCLCLVALGFLLFAEYARHRVPDSFARLRNGSKLVASASFLVVGAATFAKEGIDPDRVAFDRAIFVGLVFGAIGDIALLGRTKQAFLGGLVAFLVGHLAYLVAIWILIDPRYWLAIAGWIGLAPIIASSFAYEWLKPHLGSMKLAVTVYVVVITAMVVAAIAVSRSGLLSDRDATLIALGAILFFASDFAVARDRFVAKSFTNKLWGLPCYFAGQLLIAWTIA